MSANLAALLYLASGVLFILALRGLSSPASSRQGNLLGMIGMGIAILTTLGAWRSRIIHVVDFDRWRVSASAGSSAPKRRAKFR